MYRPGEIQENKNSSGWRPGITIRYILAIGLMLLGVIAIGYNASSPASLIVGDWRELSWEYEKVNKVDTATTHFKQISDDVKDLIGEKLVIHKSETWQFSPDGTLKLIGAKGTKQVKWKFNGRGHVLQICDRRVKESYNVARLNDTLLVINFDTDLEVRGIARLTFVKIKNNDKL